MVTVPVGGGADGGGDTGGRYAPHPGLLAALRAKPAMTRLPPAWGFTPRCVRDRRSFERVWVCQRVLELHLPHP
jgi:hypothetical protein